MTTVPQPPDPTTTYTAKYDAWNRLVSIVDTTSSNTISEYQYDGIKRRTLAKNYVSGSLDHTRHYYYSDDWQILEERIDSSTDPDRQFLWGQRYTDDLILRDHDTDSNGTLDERLYCLQDDNWNVVAISDSAGDIQERYSYDAYGLVAFLTPAFAARSASDFDWETRYAGYRWHVATQLFAVRNRCFHAPIGSWLTRDPVGYADDSYNLYGYSGNAPSTYSDAFGLGKAKCVAAVARRTGKKLFTGAKIFSERQAAKLFLKGEDILVRGGRKVATSIAEKVADLGRIRRADILRHQPHIRGGRPHYQFDRIHNRHIFYSGLATLMASGLSSQAQADGRSVEFTAIYTNPYPGTSAANALTFSHWLPESPVRHLDWVNPLELLPPPQNLWVLWSLKYAESAENAGKTAEFETCGLVGDIRPIPAMLHSAR